MTPAGFDVRQFRRAPVDYSQQMQRGARSALSQIWEHDDVQEYSGPYSVRATG